MESVDFVTSVADTEALTTLHAEMVRADSRGADRRVKGKVGREVFLACVWKLEEEAVAAERARKAASAAADEKKRQQAAAKAVWADDEMLKLTQGLKRFPGGVLNRWEKIADHVGNR
jgi:hypothetical protein